MVQKEREIIRYTRGEVEHLSDTIICEEWLDLYVNDTLVLQTPVSGREIEELIHGFLFMEGHISRGTHLDIRESHGAYYTRIEGEVHARTVRELVDCAASRIEFGDEILPLPRGHERSVEAVLRLARDFQKLPSLYHETGGVHMAAFARDYILHSADDISRRNAVDKTVGKAFLAGEQFSDGLLLTSGRVSSDIVLRMIRVQIPLVVSKSAPTDKAVELADAYGVTLCGFARGSRVNVYTHAGRLGLGE
jgi:FdhD protein